MSKINVLQRAASLRQHADRLTALVENKRAKVADASDVIDPAFSRGANELERVQRFLRATPASAITAGADMADHLDAGDLDPFLLQIRTPAQVEALLIYEAMPTSDRETFQQLATAGFDAASDGTTIMRCTLRVRRAKDVPSPYAKAALLALDAAEKENA